jgi:zinc protease
MRSIRMSGWAAVLILALGLVLLANAASAASPWVDPRQMKIPDLHEIQIPQPERFVLDNGMVVYLLEDHDFPLVDARALVRVGSIYEPAEKVGLASVTGTVMRTGGTTSIPGDSLDVILESMGASIEVSIGQTQGTASMSVLSQDLEKGFGYLNDVLRHPAFPQEKIDLAKKQERTEIASRNDEMLNILTREIPKLLYGPDSPYARHTEYATIDDIGRDDLVAFHDTFFHPDRVIMTVYGDFDSGKVKDLLRKDFGDWAKASTALPPDPPATPTDVTGVFVIDKENTTNSAVVLAQTGLKMDNPDYAALSVYHEIMGGGFGSVLFNDIRTVHGLAYATGSSPGAGLHHPGGMFFYALTQSDSTVATLGYLKQDVAKSLQEPFTDKQVQRGKDSILNSLVFSFSSKGAVLNRMAQYEYYGYPKDFLQKYQEEVKALTPQDILAAAKREVKYPKEAEVIIGTKAKFSDALASLGPYKDIDITIPEPPGGEVPDADPASLSRGQKLMGEAVAAVGGNAIKGIDDITVAMDGTIFIRGMQLQFTATSIKKGNECERTEQKLPMGTAVQTICGDQHWIQSPQGVQDMPPDAVAQQQAENERDLFVFLRTYPSLKIQALPDPVDVNGKPADVLFVRSDNVKQWRVYLDQDTHRIVRMDYRSRNPMTGTPVMVQESIQDYQKVDGIFWPHTRKLTQDGDPFVTSTVTSVKVNTGVADSIFAKP